MKNNQNATFNDNVVTTKFGRQISQELYAAFSGKHSYDGLLCMSEAFAVRALAAEFNADTLEVNALEELQFDKSAPSDVKARAERRECELIESKTCTITYGDCSVTFKPLGSADEMTTLTDLLMSIEYGVLQSADLSVYDNPIEDHLQQFLQAASIKQF